MTVALQALRERVAELHDMQTRLQSCLGDVGLALELTEAELAEAAKADLAMRPLGARGRSDGHVLRTISLEEVRDAVVKLGTFTIGELAAELGCSTAKARRELERVKHLVNPAGRLGSRQMWAYCVPDGPGAAFEAQQRLKTVQPGDLAAPGADIKQSILSMVADKEIRAVVREALADGWELVHAGGKHPMRLVRDDCRPITLSSTPRNPGNAARAIRRQLRQAS